MKNPCISALTVDVEDAVNLAMRNFFKIDIKPTERVVRNTLRLLDLFDEYGTYATFFILGEVAERYPELIKKIASQGHELGIHGYSHARYNELSREKVKVEIETAKKIVEDISGVEVIGHRAPEFSINKNNIWVLEILYDAGIKYDSSIFPARTRRYGWSDFTKNIHWIPIDNSKKIVEAPLTSVRYFGKDIPTCGGGYLRLFPFWFTNLNFKKNLNERPVNVYLHPYEIDCPPFQQFYMDAVRGSSFFNQIQLKAYWYNRKTVVPKLRNLLETYKFNTLQKVINMTLQTEL